MLYGQWPRESPGAAAGCQRESSLRQKDLWRSILGVEQTVIERVYMDHGQGAIVVRIRPHSHFGRRCGVCRRSCPGYDRGGGLHRWRTLDLGEMMCFLEAESPQVHCRTHGVVAVAVPWARHNAGHTYERAGAHCGLRPRTPGSWQNRFTRRGHVRDRGAATCGPRTGAALTAARAPRIDWPGTWQGQWLSVPAKRAVEMGTSRNDASSDKRKQESPDVLGIVLCGRSF